MTESLSQTIKRAYRDIHSSPGRTALAALVLIVLLALLVLGIQFIVRQRGSLALLNWLNLLLIPLLLVAAAVWLAGSALLAHRASPEAPSAEAGFDGGGGKFGGGGASGRY